MKNRSVDLSIVIPVFNSAHTLPILYKRLSSELKSLRRSYEIIFVDDESRDRSWNELEAIIKKDKNVIIIKLARNFGQHNALMCGFAHCNGSVVITLDDDLQNPPEEIKKILDVLEKGYDVVYGEYISKKHSLFRNAGSELIQFIYKKVFHAKGNLTAFRAIRKEIISEIIKYDRNYTFIDGLIAWQTRNIGYAFVRHDKRKSGKSNYSILKLISLSLNMITNFSIVPLQMASIMGFLFSILGLIMALFYLLKKLIFDIPVTGFASIMIVILIFSGVQLITIGLIGEYIGRIHLNINRKPQYLIRTIKENGDDAKA